MWGWGWAEDSINMCSRTKLENIFESGEVAWLKRFTKKADDVGRSDWITTEPPLAPQVDDIEALWKDHQCGYIWCNLFVRNNYYTVAFGIEAADLKEKSREEKDERNRKYYVKYVHRDESAGILNSVRYKLTIEFTIIRPSFGLALGWISFPGLMVPVRAFSFQEFSHALAITSSGENPARANDYIFNVGKPNNEVTFRQLAEILTKVYAKVSGEEPIETPTIDVSSKEFYGEGYDDSDKRIPYMTIINKQLDEAIPHGNDGGETELLYPPEYQNSLNFGGLPPSRLELKAGTPIILLRNLNLIGGLCNGTRMIVTQLLSKVIEARIITGT
ncbi:DNA helicase [Tanacetum coccineum]